MDSEVYLEKKLKNILTSFHTHVECAICLDVLTEPVTTRCNHQFCRQCILKVLDSNTSALCPLCKQSIKKRSFTECITLPNIVKCVTSLSLAIERDKNLCDISYTTALDLNRQHKASPNGKICGPLNGASSEIVPITRGIVISKNSTIPTTSVICTPKATMTDQQTTFHSKKTVVGRQLSLRNSSNHGSLPVVHSLLTQMSEEFHTSNDAEVNINVNGVKVSCSSRSSVNLHCGSVVRANIKQSFKQASSKEALAIENGYRLNSAIKKDVVKENVQKLDELHDDGVVTIASMRASLQKTLHQKNHENDKQLPVSHTILTQMSQGFHALSGAESLNDLPTSLKETSKIQNRLINESASEKNSIGGRAKELDCKGIEAKSSLIVPLQERFGVSTRCGLEDTACSSKQIPSSTKVSSWLNNRCVSPEKCEADLTVVSEMEMSSSFALDKDGAQVDIFPAKRFFRSRDVAKSCPNVASESSAGDDDACDPYTFISSQKAAPKRKKAQLTKKKSSKAKKACEPFLVPCVRKLSVTKQGRLIVSSEKCDEPRELCDKIKVLSQLQTVENIEGAVESGIDALPSTFPANVEIFDDFERLVDGVTGRQNASTKCFDDSRASYESENDDEDNDWNVFATPAPEKSPRSVEKENICDGNSSMLGKKRKSRKCQKVCIKKVRNDSELDDLSAAIEDAAKHELSIEQVRTVPGRSHLLEKSQNKNSMQIGSFTKSRTGDARLPLQVADGAGENNVQPKNSSETSQQKKLPAQHTDGLRHGRPESESSLKGGSLIETPSVSSNKMVSKTSSQSEKLPNNCNKVHSSGTIAAFPKCDSENGEHDDGSETDGSVVHFGIQQGKVFGKKEVITGDEEHLVASIEDHSIPDIDSPQTSGLGECKDIASRPSPVVCTTTTTRKPHHKVASSTPVISLSSSHKPQRKTFCLDTETQELLALTNAKRSSFDQCCDSGGVVVACEPNVQSTSHMPGEPERVSESSKALHDQSALKALNEMSNSGMHVASAEGCKGGRNADLLKTSFEGRPVRYFRLGRLNKSLLATAQCVAECQTEPVEFMPESIKTWSSVACQTEKGIIVDSKEGAVPLLENPSLKDCIRKGLLVSADLIIAASQETPATEPLFNAAAFQTQHIPSSLNAINCTNNDVALVNSTDSDATVSIKSCAVSPKLVVDSCKNESSILCSYKKLPSSQGDVHVNQQKTNFPTVAKSGKFQATPRKGNDCNLDNVSQSEGVSITSHPLEIVVMNTTASYSQEHNHYAKCLQSDTEWEDLGVSDNSDTEDVVPPTPPENNKLEKQEQKLQPDKTVTPTTVPSRNPTVVKEKSPDPEFVPAVKKFKRIIAPASGLSQSSEEDFIAPSIPAHKEPQDTSCKPDQQQNKTDKEEDHFCPAPNILSFNESPVRSPSTPDFVKSLRSLADESEMAENLMSANYDEARSNLYKNIQQDLKLADIYQRDASDRGHEANEGCEEHTENFVSQNNEDLASTSRHHEMESFGNSQSSTTSSQEIPMDTQGAQYLKEELSMMQAQMMKLKDIKAAKMKQMPCSSFILPEHSSSSNKTNSKARSAHLEKKNRLGSASIDTAGFSANMGSKSVISEVWDEIIWDEEDFQDCLFTPSPLRQQKISQIKSRSDPFDLNSHDGQQPRNLRDRVTKTYMQSSQEQHKSNLFKSVNSDKLPPKQEQRRQSRVVRKLSLASEESSPDFGNDDDIGSSLEIIVESKESKGKGHNSQKPSSKILAYNLVVSGAQVSEQINVQRLSELLNGGFSKKFTLETTHVVVKTVGNLCDRTLKFFLGISKGCWIVSYQWVIDSLKARKALPEENYEVTGDNSNGIHNGPKRSRTSPWPLFRNFEICCLEPYTEITVAQLCELVSYCGGTAIKDPAHLSRIPNTDQLIIVDKRDTSKSQRDLKDLYSMHQVPILELDWLLDSVSAYTIKDTTRYTLQPKSKK